MFRQPRFPPAPLPPLRASRASVALAQAKNEGRNEMETVRLLAEAVAKSAFGIAPTVSMLEQQIGERLRNFGVTWAILFPAEELLSPLRRRRNGLRRASSLRAPRTIARDERATSRKVCPSTAGARQRPPGKGNSTLDDSYTYCLVRGGWTLSTNQRPAAILRELRTIARSRARSLRPGRTCARTVRSASQCDLLAFVGALRLWTRIPRYSRKQVLAKPNHLPNYVLDAEEERRTLSFFGEPASSKHSQ